MRLYLILLLLALGLTISARGQYKIAIKIDNNNDSVLYLGNYYLDNTYAIDTAYVSKNGFVFTKKDKKLEDGIYFFTNNAGKFCEFVISQSRDFVLTTDEQDWTLNMKVSRSEENVIYFLYLKSTMDFGNQVKSLLEQRSTMSKQEWDKKYEALRNQNDSVKEAFVGQYPNHFLTKVLNCTKPVTIPPFTFTGDSTRYEEERFSWYKEHYFDNVDFSFGGLLRTPKAVFFTAYERYWEEILKYEREDTILYHVHKIISKCTDSNMYRFVVHNITERYLKSTIMGQDKVYVEMIKQYYKTGKAWWMPLSAINKEVERAEQWENILLGKKIPNFACPDSNDLWRDVYSLNNKYKILLFWSPECGHCGLEMPKFVSFYENYKEKLDVEVLSICTDGSKEEWQKKLQTYNTKWLNVYGIESSMDWREYFDIVTTPQAFILDQNNVIIGKKISGDNVEEYLKAVDEGKFKP